MTDTQGLPYSGSPGCNYYWTLHLSPHKINRSETNGINDTTINCVTYQICAGLRNINRIIIGHLNINSVRNRFDEFKMFATNNVNIILISGTKLDASFPSKQFLIDGY